MVSHCAENATLSSTWYSAAPSLHGGRARCSTPAAAPLLPALVLCALLAALWPLRGERAQTRTDSDAWHHCKYTYF
jgi:hypothetical protein